MSHCRFEERTQKRVPAQGARRSELRQVAGQSGIRKISFRLAGNPFDKIALEGGNFPPLESASQHLKPASRALGCQANFASQLAVIDLLRWISSSTKGAG